MLAKNYLASLTGDEKNDWKLSEEKVFLVFKFNETPDDLVVEGMMLMGNSEQTRSYFKKIAKLLHPDKNAHPLANQVFQKISNATHLAQKSF